MNIPRRVLTFGATLLLCTTITGRSQAGDPITFSSIEYRQAARSSPSAQARPANWQPPYDGQVVETLPPEPVPSESGDHVVSPLLDDCNQQPDVMVGDSSDNSYPEGARGIQPYGGGHPSDWPWGCGASPFRTGPGFCDTWRVGCRWDTTVDGMVMNREHTNLAQIWNETDGGNGLPFDDPGFMPAPNEGPQQGIPQLFEQFNYAPGGRISFIGRYPHVGYRVQGAYEGVEHWEASIIYPKVSPIQDLYPGSGNTPTAGGGLTVPGNNPTPPIDSSEQRRINYTSNLHSGELNIIKCCDNTFQPYCGVRYIRFADELRIFDDQQAPGPLAVLNPPSTTPIEVDITDMTNLFDLENNLMGFQIGVRNDFWQMSRRIGIEGFVNGGVYYNKIKYTNLMNTTTSQRIGTVTSINTAGTINFPGDATTVSATNMDTSDLSEIAYVWEANLSAVCRINKCWSMRAGYQVLWINGLRLADDAFLDPDNFTGNGIRSMLFQGWHAGIECRR